jgi:hypothetical protein
MIEAQQIISSLRLMQNESPPFCLLEKKEFTHFTYPNLLACLINPGRLEGSVVRLPCRAVPQIDTPRTTHSQSSKILAFTDENPIFIIVLSCYADPNTSATRSTLSTSNLIPLIHISANPKPNQKISQIPFPPIPLSPQQITLTDMKERDKRVDAIYIPAEPVEEGFPNTHGAAASSASHRIREEEEDSLGLGGDRDLTS